MIEYAELERTQVYIVEYTVGSNQRKFAVIEAPNPVEAQNIFLQNWMQDESSSTNWALSYQVIGNDNKPFVVI